MTPSPVGASTSVTSIASGPSSRVTRAARMLPPSSLTSAEMAREQPTGGSEPAGDPDHRPARERPRAYAVEDADDVLDVDFAGDLVQVAWPQRIAEAGPQLAAR